MARRLHAAPAGGKSAGATRGRPMPPRPAQRLGWPFPLYRTARRHRPPCRATNSQRMLNGSVGRFSVRLGAVSPSRPATRRTRSRAVSVNTGRRPPLEKRREAVLTGTSTARCCDKPGDARRLPSLNGGQSSIQHARRDAGKTGIHPIPAFAGTRFSPSRSRRRASPRDAAPRAGSGATSRRRARPRGRPASAGSPRRPGSSGGWRSAWCRSW